MCDAGSVLIHGGETECGVLIRNGVGDVHTGVCIGDVAPDRPGLAAIEHMEFVAHQPCWVSSHDCSFARAGTIAPGRYRVHVDCEGWPPAMWLEALDPDHRTEAELTVTSPDARWSVRVAGVFCGERRGEAISDCPWLVTVYAPGPGPAIHAEAANGPIWTIPQTADRNYTDIVREASGAIALHSVTNERGENPEPRHGPKGWDHVRRAPPRALLGRDDIVRYDGQGFYVEEAVASATATPTYTVRNVAYADELAGRRCIAGPIATGEAAAAIARGARRESSLIRALCTIARESFASKDGLYAAACDDQDACSATAAITARTLRDVLDPERIEQIWTAKGATP